ncbi:MAG: hypothetical protein SO069_05750 [Succinivibrio sp.]|nr:hypothetical protein [Succinivibrio sp.]
MINLNTVANANHVATTTLDNKTNVATATEVNKQVNTGASAVVELQTNVADVNAKSSIKVDATNAKAFVADIAAMLGQSNGSVQANLNCFDAARLLA